MKQTELESRYNLPNDIAICSIYPDHHKCPLSLSCGRFREARTRYAVFFVPNIQGCENYWPCIPIPAPPNETTQVAHPEE